MAIKVTENSKKLLTEIILKEFHNINWSMDFVYQRAPKIIKMTKEFGLTELAEELETISKQIE